MKTARLLCLASLLVALVLVVPPAFGDEDDVPTDPSVFLRRARVLVTVDRDTEALRQLVYRVTDANGGEKEWLLAWLEVSRILERHGQKGDALTVLRMVTEKHGRDLTEAQKNEVHAAMVRLLPPGASATSPLGMIFKAASDAGPSPRSPLETKIRDLFEKLTVASVQDQNAVNRARQQIVWALRDAGPEVHPVLGVILLEGQPEQSRYAAEMLADFAKVDALPQLERALLTGDGMARSAALRGYSSIDAADDVSPQVVEHLDRLISGLAPKETLATLRGALLRHLSTDALLERYESGNEDASRLLTAALHREPLNAGAIKEAIARAGRFAEERGALVRNLNQLLFGRSNMPVYRDVDDAVLRDLLDVLVRIPAADASSSAHYIVTLLEHLESEDVETILRPAWESLREPDSDQYGSDRIKAHVQTLLNAGHLPPPDLYADPDWRLRFFTALTQVNPNTIGSVVDQAEFWPALLDTLPALERQKRQWLLHKFNHLFDPEAYPASIGDGRPWADLLEIEPLRSDARVIPHWLIRAAGAEGDERVLAYIKTTMTRSDWHQSGLWLLLRPLKSYKGPGLLAFCEDTLRGPSAHVGEVSHIVDLLATLGDEGRDLLVRLATDWTLPSAPLLVQRIGRSQFADAADELKRLYPRVLDHYDEVDVRYLRAVVNQARARLHREAVPLLLRAYRDQLTEAASALDAIREYHDRLDAFEGWAAEEDGEVGKLIGLLGHENPTTRRAAVFALAALAAKEALPRLVEMATADSDADVRKAAMAALEKMAK